MIKQIVQKDIDEINEDIGEFERTNCKKKYSKKALISFAQMLKINGYEGLGKEELCKLIVKRLRTSRITKEKIDTKAELIKEDKLLLKEKINKLDKNEWILPNKRSFIDFILDDFEKSVDSFDKEPKTLDNQDDFNLLSLFNHQKYIVEYIQEDSPYRGLLLYHGLGSGKTASSISIVEGFHNKKVIVMLPASLETNYKKEIYKYGDISYKKCFHWQKIELNDKIIDQLEEKGFTRQYINYISTNKILWLIKKNGNFHKTNYTELKKQDKESLDKQIEKIIEYKYNFIHYNGGNSVYKRIYDLLSNDVKKQLKTELNLDDDINIKKILNHILVKRLELNPFNNKVIVVDEVHNLILMIVNGSAIGGIIYNLLMNSENCRLVFLSGTPVINTPFELAIMFNLLRGYTKTYRYKLKSIKNDSDLRKLLMNEKMIDRIIIESNIFDITRLPYNFLYNEDRSSVYREKDEEKNNIENNTSNDKEFDKYISKVLNNNGYIKKDELEITNNSIFPDIIVDKQIDKKNIFNAIEKFKKLYIDDKKNLKNNDFFEKRILGLVSFYNEITDEDPEIRKELFPTKEIDNSGEISFSDYQFIQYIQDRNEEIEFDKKNEKKKMFNPDDDLFSFFRVYSRQSSNFVFPPNIKRIRKKDIEEEQNYDEQAKLLLRDLTKENLTINDSIYDLKNLSPKYAKILDNIYSSPGLVLCYSQFRNVEGIGVFTKILDMNGFKKYSSNKSIKDVGDCEKKQIGDVEVKMDDDLDVGATVRVKLNGKYHTNIIRKIEDDKYYLNDDENIYTKQQLFRARYILYTGTENAIERQNSLEAFNNKKNRYGEDILVILITSSGAEGLSLFNVRQVHILEPYWNEVRTKQVEGRARRIKSHIHLKEDEQNVKIFQYKSVLTDKQLSNDIDKNLEVPPDLSAMIQEVSTRDKKVSTDEYLYNISEKKTFTINQFLDLIKKAAVDCSYNKNDNILSDNSLERIECIEQIDTKGEYAYNIGNKDKPYYNIESEEDLIKKIKESRKKLKIFDRTINGVKLRFILEESNRKNKNIYDFYAYFNLYPNYEHEIGVRELIGTINNGKLKIDIDEKFTLMKIIEESINILNMNIPDSKSTNEYYVEFSKKVSEYSNNILKTKWVCPFCDTTNNVYDNHCVTVRCQGSLLFYLELQKAYIYAKNKQLI